MSEEIKLIGRQRGIDYLTLIELCIESPAYSLIIDPYYKYIKVTEAHKGTHTETRTIFKARIDEPEVALEWIKHQLS